MESHNKVTQFPADRIVRKPEAVAQEIYDAGRAARALSVIDEERVAGSQPYLWSELKQAEMRREVSNFTLKDAIDALNLSTEDAWRARPTYYAALIAHINDLMPTSQGDE